jgi:nicotinate-nucleotide pyrophosphorylase (carboxylating)
MIPATTSRLRQAGLEAVSVARLVELTLAEDEAAYDVTSRSTVPEELTGLAEVRSRVAGVVAGLPVAIAVLDTVARGRFEVRSVAEDGDRVAPGDVVLAVRARVRDLLAAERTLLNLLCHLSGVATLTRRWVDAVEGTGAEIRDTRKTLPGLRNLQKYAVRCGGGRNHRVSLADAALVKDNHVVAAGGVGAAFSSVRAAFPDLEVEVECDTLDQVGEAVAAGADLVLLDNMDLATTREAVTVCQAAGVRTEASGGLSLQGARAVAETGVTFLSVGALTHSAPALDLGLDLSLEPSIEALLDW